LFFSTVAAFVVAVIAASLFDLGNRDMAFDLEIN